MRRAVLVANPAALVADQATARIERNSRERTPAVADRADHEPAGDHLLLPRWHGAAVLQSVAGHADTGHGTMFAIAEELDRRTQEPQRDAPAGGAGRPLGMAPQDLDVAARRGLQVVVDLDIDLHAVDQHVDTRQGPQLAQLRAREGGLRRPAAPE